MGTRRRYKLLCSDRSAEGGWDRTYFGTERWEHLPDWKTKKPVLCFHGFHCYFHPLQACLFRCFHVGYHQDVLYAVDVKGLKAEGPSKEAWTAVKVIKKVPYKYLRKRSLSGLIARLQAIGKRVKMKPTVFQSEQHVVRDITQRLLIKKGTRTAVIRAYHAEFPVK